MSTNPRTTRYLDTTVRTVDTQFRLLDELNQWTDAFIGMSDELQRGLDAPPVSPFIMT